MTFAQAAESHLDDVYGYLAWFTGDGLGQMLSARFRGAITTQAHEIADRETLDTLLVPSNQGEYLPEIEVPEIREAVIAELLDGDVLPALHASPAGTALGYNVHWTFGDFRRLAE